MLPQIRTVDVPGVYNVVRSEGTPAVETTVKYFISSDTQICLSGKDDATQVHCGPLESGLILKPNGHGLFGFEPQADDSEIIEIFMVCANTHTQTHTTTHFTTYTYTQHEYNGRMLLHKRTSYRIGPMASLRLPCTTLIHSRYDGT